MRSLRETALEIANRLLPGPSGLVLDFDGTLTEIVADPDAPVLSGDRRDVLRALAGFPSLRLAVLSGRARADVERRVGVPGVTYAGNHGLEMEGWTAPGVAAARPALERYLEDLRGGASLPVAIRVEDKGATATVHLVGTREPAVRDALLAALEERVAALWPASPARGGTGPRGGADAGAAGAEPPPAPLRLHPGKASVEVRPRVAWDKATAFRRLLEIWGVPPARGLYAGDDVTDECVFEGVPEAVGVKVGDGATAARYRASSPAEVVEFLRILARRAAG